MANSKSAKKRIQTHERNRERNRAARTVLRTQLKKFRVALAAGDAVGTKDLLAPTHALIDQSAQKGVIHDRAAARYKSRLTRAHDRLQVASS